MENKNKKLSKIMKEQKLKAQLILTITLMKLRLILMGGTKYAEKVEEIEKKYLKTNNLIELQKDIHLFLLELEEEIKRLKGEE